jgi:uncharacterized membrane protein
MRDRNIPKRDIVLLGIIAFLFVLIFSFSTSPLYPNYWGSDSAQFQTIGMAWASGKIPYRDIFDHKGPFIFWVNMLGYKMGGRAGVFTLQILFLFFTFIGIYKIITIISWKMYIKQEGGILISIIFLANMYSGGNMCEEYCLPFLMFSAFGQLSFFTKQNKQLGHNVWWGFFYGITVSVCVLTRATNAIAVVCGIAVIIVAILREKKYKNLVYNALFFLTGLIVMFVPFGIYFGIKGAFGEFLFGTLGYNIIYATDMKAWITGAGLDTWIIYCKMFFSVILCIPAFILAIINKNKYCAGYYLLVGAMENYLFCTGALYQHYAIIALPNVCMFIVEMERMIQKDKKSYKKLIQIAAFAVGVTGMVYIGEDTLNKVNVRLNNNNQYSAEYDRLMIMIPEEDQKSVAAYGGGALKNFYLRYNIIPCYRFFVLQESQGKRSDYLTNEIALDFALCKAAYILTDEDISIVYNIIQERYEKFGQTQRYTLYKRIDV